MAEYKLDTFLKNCSDMKIMLTEEQQQQFIRYYEILVEWNSFMNLTGITEFNEVLQKHFEDSLALVRAVSVEELSTKKRVIDIGTGAGFPGVPLKIAFPELEVVLLDSLGKRIKFLDHVIAELGLHNITAIHGRAEDYAKDAGYRESFDFSVSRAVANLSSLSEYALPYTKVGGYFIPYKSGKIDEEVEAAGNAIKILGGQLMKIEKFTLADSDIERSLVIIKKIRQTAKKYPRKAGLPAKEPL